MSNLKIELTLEGTNEELVAMTGQLMAALSKAPVAVNPTTPEIQEKPAKTQPAKSAPKAEESKKETDKPKTQPAKSAPKAEESKKESESEGSISLDDIRPLMSAKISSHRDQVKAKMTELGAGNLSSIPESELENFYNFLKDLSDD